MWSAIVSFFQNVPEDYEALQKKDDDLYVRALENWNAKYQIGNIDTEKKVELMAQELLQIPMEFLTFPEIQKIGRVLHKVACKREKYKEIFIEILTQKDTSRYVKIGLLLDHVYLAFPTNL